MNKKIFAFDIDGTFINRKEEVQQSHIEALMAAKEKGHTMIFCTGRPYLDIIPIIKQMPEDLIEYLVCNNGAYIYHLPTNEFLESKTISYKFLEQFEEIGRSIKALYAIHTEVGTKRGLLFNENDRPEWFEKVIDEEWNKFHTEVFEESKEWSKDKDIYQLSLRSTKEEIQNVVSKFDNIKDQVDIHVANEVYLDINPIGISKLVGLQNISKILNVDIKDFIAFGDSGNDIQMLKGVGKGIAMGNATQEAKDSADIVIGDHNTSALSDKVMELI